MKRYYRFYSKTTDIDRIIHKPLNIYLRLQYIRMF